MRLLLDTHIILWMFGDPTALSIRARTLVEEPDNELFFSPVSLFELAVKSSSKGSDLVVDLHELRHEMLLQNITELPLISRHAMCVALLPTIHKDPFDRLLLAQAVEEQLMLLTVDGMLLRYPSNMLDAR
jgi:PIN domain nuclease of toxin-antitoxin system